MKVRQWSLATRDGADPHHVAVVIAGKRRVEVTESPTGRSVQVWVDGARVFPTPENVECPCERCNPQTDLYRRFTMCPDCGNKRCPKGTDHDLDCTGSNEPGQTGSSWANYTGPENVEGPT